MKKLKNSRVWPSQKASMGLPLGTLSEGHLYIGIVVVLYSTSNFAVSTPTAYISSICISSTKKVAFPPLSLSLSLSLTSCTHEEPLTAHTYLLLQLILPFLSYHNHYFYTRLHRCWKYYPQLRHFWQLKGSGSAFVGRRHRLQFRSHRRTKSQI